MAVHRFETEQALRINRPEAWEFFSAPRNLAAITPPDMGFEITSPVPDRAYAGLLIGRVPQLGPSWGHVWWDWVRPSGTTKGKDHKITPQNGILRSWWDQMGSRLAHWQCGGQGFEPPQVHHFPPPFGQRPSCTAVCER